MFLRTMLLVTLVPTVAVADKTFTKGTGDTWDCAKDAVVTIKTAKGTYGFLGECKRITITGGKNAVSIATVGKLVESIARSALQVRARGNRTAAPRSP